MQLVFFHISLAIVYFRGKLLTHLVFFFVDIFLVYNVALSIFQYILIANLQMPVAPLSPHICCAWGCSGCGPA